jgi:hypothetical protein
MSGKSNTSVEKEVSRTPLLYRNISAIVIPNENNDNGNSNKYGIKTIHIIGVTLLYKVMLSMTILMSPLSISITMTEGTQ